MCETIACTIVMGRAIGKEDEKGCLGETKK